MYTSRKPARSQLRWEALPGRLADQAPAVPADAPGHHVVKLQQTVSPPLYLIDDQGVGQRTQIDYRRRTAAAKEGLQAIELPN